MANRRKVSSSSTAKNGAFTRSKADIFLHRTRSGHSRIDPKRHHHHQPMDLRLKRVFSRIEDKIIESEDLEVSKGSTDDGLRETPPPDLEIRSEFDGGEGIRFSEETNLGIFSANNLGFTPCSRPKVIGNPSCNSYRRLLPYLKDLAKDGSSGLQILQYRNLSTKTDKALPPDIKVLNGIGVGVSEETNLGNSVENKQAPSSCSWSKLIVNRSSISYRRLLPYLKDLDKEDTSDTKILQSHNHPLEVEKTEKEITLVSTPSYERQNNVPPLRDFPIVNSDIKCDIAGNQALENPILISQKEIVQNPVRIESPIQELASKAGFADDHTNKLNEHLKISATFSDATAQSTPPDTDLTRKLDAAENVSRRTILELESNNTSKESTGLVLCSRSKLYRNPSSLGYRRLLPHLNDIPSPARLKENKDLDLDSQGDIHDPKPTDMISPKRLDFEVDMCKSSPCYPTISEDLSFEEIAGEVMMEIDRKEYTLAPRKSILKKQSRRCKGICLCLDCASFRLHAERGYEFSRRQMLGADEVVERLLKEMACLRSVLESSHVPTVKRVCQRAIGVEEEVKSRMRQMFCDLNTHCKIPGPRVAFSDTVDERVIP